MAKPVAFVRLDIARFGIEVADRLKDSELAKWVRSLHRCLALNDPGLNEFGAILLSEAEQFAETVSERQREKALKRWKKDATASHGIATASHGNAEDAYKQASKHTSKQALNTRDLASLDPWFSEPGFEEAWKAWEKSRKKKAGDRQLASLKKLSAGNLETATAILNQSANNQWQGLFALKGTNGTHRKPTRAERLDADAEQFLRDLGAAPEGDRSAAQTNGSLSRAGNALRSPSIAHGG